jgi:hypothetical protein
LYVSSLFCNYAGLERLASSIEQAEVMQARARDCLRMRTPLPELQQLVEDAAALPVHVPDVEAVSALLAKAQDWLKRAQVAASQVSCTQPNFASGCCSSEGGWLQSVFIVGL